MSILEKANNYILDIIFGYSEDKIKLKLLKSNKKLQNKNNITIFDYQNFIFLNNKTIEKEILLNYYQYLKRAYENIYSLKTIQKYYIEFFCKFLKDNKINNFILDSIHELAIDILLYNRLEKIQILINVEDYKHDGYIDKCYCYKNKKPFLKLFQALFNNPKVDKIIIVQNEEGKDDIQVYRDSNFREI